MNTTPDLRPSLLPDGVHVLARGFPSGASVLLPGPCPVVVDTGYGSGARALAPWLRAAGVAPERLSLIVNTHFHSDHAGGNHHLQQAFGTPVAAHPAEAALVNARDPDACRARWLVQPIEPYVVARTLCDGDVVDTGRTSWRVVATPGHTAGHLSLFADGMLILGDAAHANDVGWVSRFREGADAPEQAADSLRRLLGLRARVAVSGHGPVIADPAHALARALDRLAGWADRPERMVLHAAKRILGHHLIASGGVPGDMLHADLRTAPWVHDHAGALGQEVEAFIAMLLREMVRADAATLRDGALVSTAPHHATDPGWPVGPTDPARWPAAQPGSSPALR